MTTPYDCLVSDLQFSGIPVPPWAGVAELPGMVRVSFMTRYGANLEVSYFYGNPKGFQEVYWVAQKSTSRGTWMYKADTIQDALKGVENLENRGSGQEISDACLT